VALLPDLHSRAELSELMDQPDSDEESLRRTVGHFRWTNLLVSRIRGLLTRHVVADMRTCGRGCYSVLDVGAGGCDIALWLVDHCRRRGIRLQVRCLDHDPRVVRFAREATSGHPEIEVHESSAADVGRLPEHDYVLMHHVLHHLHEEEVLGLLELFAQRTRRVLLINDLSRSRLSYAAFAALSVAFARRSFSRRDGLTSIRRAFRKDELERLVARTSMRDRARVFGLFPGRVVVLAKFG